MKPLRSVRNPILCAAALACLATSACRRDEAEPAEPPAEPAIALAPGDSVFAPEPEREVLPSDRIYYTLTDHSWYARGEPLVHDGRAYQPNGMPVSASLPEMRRAGAFHGVEYYVREGDSEPAVYVPVFPGYWQVFRPTGARVAAPADIPAAPADTMPVDTAGAPR